MKLTFVFLSLLVLGLTSCTYTHKAKVLENGAITVIYLTDEQEQYAYNGDTVWVNMNTHKIDDTDSTAMQCVLINKSTH